MDVRVEQQVLTPRVQDAEETDLGSEMFVLTPATKLTMVRLQ